MTKKTGKELLDELISAYVESIKRPSPRIIQDVVELKPIEYPTTKVLDDNITQCDNDD